MKRLIVVLALLLLAPVPVVKAAAKGAAPAAGAAKTAPVLEVADLMRDVDRLKGTLRVEGLVTKVFPKERQLGLIDATEFRKCGAVSDCCANVILPVRWTGPMPAVKSLVRLEGEIRKAGDKLEFVAKSLEQVPAK